MKSKRYKHIEAFIGKTENFLQYVHEMLLKMYAVYHESFYKLFIAATL